MLVGTFGYRPLRMLGLKRFNTSNEVGFAARLLLRFFLHHTLLHFLSVLPDLLEVLYVTELALAATRAVSIGLLVEVGEDRAVVGVRVECVDVGESEHVSSFPLEF